MGQWFNNNGGNLIGSLLDGLRSIGSNVLQMKLVRETNAQNVALQRETNALNAQMVREQNAAAMSESEKARSYDSATAQVGRLRAAGMSKAGALGAINGAGGYTPAPVNAAQAQAPQVQAPQVDLTGVSNAIQGFMQLSEQKRQFNETMKLEREKFAEEQINNAKNREFTDVQIKETLSKIGVNEVTQQQIIANTDYLLANTELTRKKCFEVAANIELLKTNKNHVEEQIKSELANRGLTEAQTSIAWKQYEELCYKLDEYMSDEAKLSRISEYEMKTIIKQTEEYVQSIKCSEASQEEMKTAQERIDFEDKSTFGFRMLHFLSLCLNELNPLSKIKLGGK